MPKDKCRQCILALLLVLALSPGARLQPQQPQPVTPTVIPSPKPTLQATADGELQPFKLMGKGVRASVFAHPVPNVYLVFPASQNSPKMTIELPPEAKKPLSDCWKAELEYYYKSGFESRPLDKRIQDSYALGRANMSVLSRLERIEINTPNGKRKISGDEAGDLVKFMAQSAQQIVEQAKESKRLMPVAKN